MRAFLAAKIGLLPFILFWSLAPSQPRTAALLALALSAALNFWRWRAGETKQMELAGLPLFALLALAPVSATASLSLSFFALAFAAFVSLGRKKPWTADYSAASNADFRATPMFIGINKALSALWMGVFLLLGLLTAVNAPHVLAAALVAVGALASIFGPKQLVNAALKKQLAAQNDFDWPAPDFTAASREKFDVVVIGAGVGGLSAAALLAQAGLRVKIFEHHVLPGGYCHSWLRKAPPSAGEPAPVFRFDAGPHDFSGAWKDGALDRLLRRLGCADKVDWLRLDYRQIDAKGGVFDPPRDIDEHIAQLVRRHGGDSEGVREVFRIMRAVFDGLFDRDGFAGPPENVESMLNFGRRHPLFVVWSERRFAQLLREKLKTPEARAALGVMTGYVADDSETPSCVDMAPIFGYWFKGGFCPRGGTSVFAETLCDAFRAAGGEIAFKTEVRRIVVENGAAVGVALANGEIVRARAIVANSDPGKTFLQMIASAHLPEDFRKKIEQAAPATSGFAVHLGVRGEAQGQPLTFIAGDLNILVAQPGLVDPSDAPEGFCAVDLFTLLPHDEARDWMPPEGADWKQWRFSAAYQQRKQLFAERMIDAAEKALPGLREKIVFRCEASPLTYARYDLSSAGSIYGIAPSGRMRGAKSPIRNLVVAGAVNLGPGVEAAALSGVWAAAALYPQALHPQTLEARQRPVAPIRSGEATAAEI